MGAVEKLSAELRDMLAASDRLQQLFIDPRDIDLRFSNVKNIAKSARHYWHACQYSKEQTLCMRLGSGTHALLFGTPEVVVYAKRRAGNDWKKFKAEKEAEGKLILNEREFETASGMAQSVRNHMDADLLIHSLGARYEEKIRWKIGDRNCQGTIDVLGKSALVDLKATKDTNPKLFPSSAVRSGWIAQTVWYADGCERAGLGWREPYLVAVENTAPYCTTVWRLDEEAIEFGRGTYTSWVERVLQCEERNEWPGYTSEVMTLTVPSYLRDSDWSLDDTEDKPWQSDETEESEW